MTRVRESVSSPQSAHMDNHSVETHRESRGKAGALAQSAKCETAQIRHLCQVKTLTASACLKHFEFHKTVNKAGMCLTAVHMKPFSMKERTRHWDRLIHVQLLMRSESD